MCSWRGCFVCLLLHLGDRTTIPNITEEAAYNISPSMTYNVVLSSLPRQLNNHSHLGSPNPSNTHDGRLGQTPQDAPTTLKLRAHMCPERLCEDTPTQSLKACNSPPVS